MTLRLRIGIAAMVLVVLAGLAVGTYIWERPLSVYAMFSRRALAGAGLTAASAETGFGLQNYRTGGQGSTLVLLHGAGDQAGTWSGVAPVLASRYRVVIPDLAGHGKSAPADGPISLKQGASRRRNCTFTRSPGPCHHRRQLARGVGCTPVRTRTP